MQAFAAPGAGFGDVVQVAYLVEDVDRAMEQWVRHAGVGPWTCFRNIRLDATYQGAPLELRIHEALSYVGSLQIQLVQSLNPPEVATPYQADLARGRFGLHHVAFFAHDVEADIGRAERQGFERTCEMRDADGHRYFYCRSKALPDVWIELLEFFPFLEQVFREGIAASRGWDGRDPVRNFEYAELRTR